MSYANSLGKVIATGSELVAVIYGAFGNYCNIVFIINCYLIETVNFSESWVFQ